MACDAEARREPSLPVSSFFSEKLTAAGGIAYLAVQLIGMFLMAGRTFDLTSSGRFSCQVRVTLPTNDSSLMSHLCHRARARDHRTRA